MRISLNWPGQAHRERTDGRLAELERMLVSAQERLKAVEVESLALEELRRTAVNAVRSLRRMAANVQEAAGGPNGPPPLTPPLTVAAARARIAARRSTP